LAAACVSEKGAAFSVEEDVLVSVISFYILIE